jgi:hypothetical protein
LICQGFFFPEKKIELCQIIGVQPIVNCLTDFPGVAMFLFEIRLDFIKTIRQGVFINT